MRTEYDLDWNARISDWRRAMTMRETVKAFVAALAIFGALVVGVAMGTL